MMKLSRRSRSATAAGLAVALGLTLGACGSSSGSAAEGDGEITFSWWGSDPRHKANESIMASFMEANGDITVKADYSDFSSYWDKLATTTAGGDAPDVITMDEKYLQEYAGRGALAELTELDGLDLSKFDDESLALGEYDDQLYGLSTGRNAYTVMVNEDLFEQAGVEIPDDSTWTWEDYYETSAAISSKLDGVVGTDYGALDVDLRIWLRQQGESLYNEEAGEVGYSDENVTSWFQHLLDVRDVAKGPTAAEYSESISGTFEAEAFATNRAAMGWYWSNQLSALRTATDANVRMLRAPSPTGNAADNGMYYKASMYWSVSAKASDPEAAAKFVNYLANNEEAAKKLLVDRGVPVNPDMAEAIKPELSESDQTVVAFLDEIGPDVAEAPKPSPVGAGGVQDVILRYVSEVLFEELTPEEATKAMTDEISGMIKAG